MGRCSRSVGSSSAASLLQSNRQAVISALGTLASDSAGPALDESFLPQTIRQFLRLRDVQMAKALMSEVVYKLVPWLDADGKLGSVCVAELLADQQSNVDARGALKDAIDLAEQMSAALSKHSQAGSAPELAMKLILAQILHLADDVALDRWIRLVPRGLEALPLAQTEELVSRVYMKRRRWDRIRSVLSQISQRSEEPSVTLYGELFESLLAPCLRGQKFVMARAFTQQTPGATWGRLQAELEEWRQLGLPLGRNCAEALESCMLQQMAPPHFLQFLADWVPLENGR